MMGARYEHTQVGRLILSLVLPMAALLLVLPAILGWHPALLTGVGALVAIAVLFGSLTVKVEEGLVTARFGPGPVRFRFRRDQIVSARAVRNPWWYGWGIRITPHGRLLNVSGLDAVEIVLRGGRRWRIGSDEPRRLLAALEAPETR